MRKSFVIGIAGGSGSGKSSIVKAIEKNLSTTKFAVIEQDWYYKDQGHLTPEQKKAYNFDHPEAIEFPLLIDHIEKLKQGQPVNAPVYSYIECSRAGKTIKIDPLPVIIVEGLLLYVKPALTHLFDLRLFIETDEQTRIERIIERDKAQRARTREEVLKRYEKTVKPMHMQYINPSKINANIIIRNEKNIDHVAGQIVKIIKRYRA